MANMVVRAQNKKHRTIADMMGMGACSKVKSYFLSKEEIEKMLSKSENKYLHK